MKEVKYHELESWGWGCPDCGAWNTTDEDPQSEDALECEICFKEFKPIPA